VLWWELLKLVNELKTKKPRFIFLENVDRLLKSPSKQRGRDFAIMLKTLGDAGYLVEWRAVNAAEYGFAQRRIRVFIVARRIDKLAKGFKFDPTKQIFTDGILARALPVGDHHDSITLVDLAHSADLISESFNKGVGKSLFENTGVYFKNIAYTTKTKAIKARDPMTLGDVILEDSEVPKEYWISKNRLPEWEYLKGAKSIERVHKASGTKYNYAEGKMAYPDLLTNPSRTILTGEGGTSPSRFKHIIKTKKGHRRLTPIELERLNGFPDDWTKFDANGAQVSDVRRAFFMGNALVIGLIERVGKVLADEASS
jgi:DNA (cytosine-5)-methyltransferase 1